MCSESVNSVRPGSSGKTKDANIELETDTPALARSEITMKNIYPVFQERETDTSEENRVTGTLCRIRREIQH